MELPVVTDYQAFHGQASAIIAAGIAMALRHPTCWILARIVFGRMDEEGE